MSKRREFSITVRREAAKRSGCVCERALWRPGETCTRPAKHFDHIKPDGLGGEPTLANCAYLCVPCHAEKTATEDVPRMAKADAQRDHIMLGVRRKSKPIRSAPFPKSEKAAKRTPKPALPARELYR